MRFYTSLKGKKLMQRRLREVSSSINTKALHALQVEGNAIMRAAKKVTPFDPGTSDGAHLRDSGKVDTAKRVGDNLLVRLSFGEDQAQAYALAVHEHPSVHSPPSWSGVNINWQTPGTGPKYLETPLRLAEAGMEIRLASRMKI